MRPRSRTPRVRRSTARSLVPCCPEATYACPSVSAAPIAAPRHTVADRAPLRRSRRAPAGLLVLAWKRSRRPPSDVSQRSATTVVPNGGVTGRCRTRRKPGSSRTTTANPVLLLDDLGHASRARARGQLQNRARSAPVGERPSPIVEREQPRGPEPAGDEQRRRTAPVRRRQRLGRGEEIVRAHLPAQRARPPAGATLEEEADPCSDGRLEPAGGAVRRRLDVDRAPHRALDAPLDAEGEDRAAVAEVAALDQTSDERAVGLGEEAARVGHRARARVRGGRGCRDDGDRRDHAGEKEPHARHTPPVSPGVTSRPAQARLRGTST